MIAVPIVLLALIDVGAVRAQQHGQNGARGYATHQVEQLVDRLPGCSLDAPVNCAKYD